jgi:DNA-binding MarR family transcriptional regulator
VVEYCHMNKLTPNGDAFTELILEIFRVNRLLLDAGDELTAPVDLTSARWQVLGVVEHGPVPVANVARIMGLTRQSVQQTADSLAEDGLIEFVDNPHHRRARLMRLTSRGRDALDYVEVRHAVWANRIGEQHPLERLRDAWALLRALKASLEERQPSDPDL